MAMTWNTGNTIEAKPKKTRQGNGKHTKYSASSRNGKRKPYRGQGKRPSLRILLGNQRTYSIVVTGIQIMMETSTKKKEKQPPKALNNLYDRFNYCSRARNRNWSTYKIL